MSRLIRYIQFSLLLSSLLMMQGCVADDSGDSPEMIVGEGLKVSARKANHVYTRSYQDEGTVVSGKYYLSYPNTDRTYTLAVVDFDKMAAESPGLGIVNTLSGSELKWSDIGGSPVTFYLDNVDQKYGTGPEAVFTANDNPFVAGLFDSEEGTNDLLWGEKSVNVGTKSLGFDLHHNMSRVRVQVEVVHKDNSVEDITLEGATVRITNLYSRPTSFNRTDGTLTLDTESADEGILIVAPDSENPGYDWKDSDTSDPDKTLYFSQDIILPPQSPAEDFTRSRLVITLENGDVYDGILPHAMFIAAPDNTLNYPVTLSFLKEYILTIHTVITEQPPELVFMPVWVTEWVDKGEFTLESHQSGIYTPEEFYKLIGYYEAVNEYQLVRYGYLYSPDDTDTETKLWHFDFFSSVSLDYDRIYRKMIPGHTVVDKGEAKNFEFAFNNYSIYVYNGSEDNMVKVTQTQLYDIVTGNMTWQQLQQR